MRTGLAVLLFVLATDLASAAPAPAELPPVTNLVGAGGASAPLTICPAPMVATLQGTADAEGRWTMVLRSVQGPYPYMPMICPVRTEERAFAGPWSTGEGGCLPAADGGRDWLCVDPVLRRVDLGVHVDVCYRLAPCAHSLRASLHVAVA